MTSEPYQLPLKIKHIPAGYMIEDANGLRIAHVYTEPDETRRGITRSLTPEAGLEIARRIARALTGDIPSGRP
jgi:hypothetical protein